MKVIEIEKIKITGNHRPLNDEKVKQLAESINMLGLLNPITINSDNELIAGRHRLEASKLLGYESIMARVINHRDLYGELARIDENLIRSELSVLEQGEHLNKREEILENLKLRAQSGTNIKNLRTGDTVTPVKTTKEIAEEVGINERSAQRSKQIAQNIIPEIKEEIKNTPLANQTTKLLELSRMKPEEQRTAWPRLGVHFSSKSQEWYTPPEIIERVVKLLKFIDLDPCSENGENPNVPADKHFTVKENGLEQIWFGKVYMNPPYGRGIGEWIEKLCSEYESGNVKEAVALVPARPDTDWFDKLNDYAVCFIRGRLKFNEMESSAPFPSCTVYFGSDINSFNNAFGDMGTVRIKWGGDQK